MKQTAVEWLIDMLPTINKDEPYYQAIIQQAKEMENEQIRDAYKRSIDDKGRSIELDISYLDYNIKNNNGR